VGVQLPDPGSAGVGCKPLHQDRADTPALPLVCDLDGDLRTCSVADKARDADRLAVAHRHEDMMVAVHASELFELARRQHVFRATEAQMARAANCPPWRHAMFGLMMGGLVASPAFDMPIRLSILVIVLALIPLIIHSDRKRMGMFINGYRRGKTRVVAIGVVIVELSLYAVSVVRHLDHNDHIAPLMLGAAGVLIGTLGSLLWQRVFVREMGA